MERDSYIDVLRTFGVFLLVVAHTSAPDWLTAVRTFDVPLMVFISAICYKPSQRRISAYLISRVKRIYIPVTIFLCTFFLSKAFYCIIMGQSFDFNIVIGSFLLLNGPSIGYVWIMRVFLMMALLIPLYYRLLKNVRFGGIIVLLFLIIIIQHVSIILISKIENKIINFILDETFLYAIGYSAIVIIGLKIKTFNRSEILILTLVTVLSCIIIIGYNDWIFNYKTNKYPPRALYLLYGISWSTILWLLKSILQPMIKGDFFVYVSKNSMWIYLWHIVPIYIFEPIMHIPNMWFLRYLLILTCAFLLNYLYHSIIKTLPSTIYNLIK